MNAQALMEAFSVHCEISRSPVDGSIVVVNCEPEPGWADGGEDGMINN